ncbi:UDP-3-O-(3-hydroxymyristoyl)glucosamine N-acyltransferase [Maricaulis maris]|uniref:UDP-3-O-acylglucosamine N-acyltransferase n=1 Tax=Maricaulis maris TaxID=74318 RepID=A0A495DLE6_9PROT|nr:UDP-3-O-(3-hydroxymyristoyl)glucosamine N-acyltransferase [Maricaulis maris]RKR02748.1 UDP-3-O-[3-hydroxymyristoyl] glucosamine N-acyltransferase [Maricaulis maris]
MADPRFYDRLGPLTLQEIAALSGAAISDSAAVGISVEGVAPLGEGGPGTLAYAETGKHFANAPAGALDGVVVICPLDAANEAASLGATTLTHDAPRTAFAHTLPHLFRLRGFDVDTFIHPTARIDETASLAAGVVVGAGAEIGADCAVGPHSVIGPGCRLGAGTRLAARVSLLCCEIGENCNILAGAVIGEDGFGVAISNGINTDILHLGSVVIGRDVTIGANTAIDRGVFGATRIGDGTKIDNLCHIAHNARIGRQVVMAGYTGLAGSAVIGDRAVLAGRVGVYDHVRIGEGAQVGANSAASRDVPAGEFWVGNPAQPLRQHLRELAELRRLAKTGKKTSKKG